MRLASEEDLVLKSTGERLPFSDSSHIDLNIPVTDVPLQPCVVGHYCVTTWLGHLL